MKVKVNIKTKYQTGNKIGMTKIRGKLNKKVKSVWATSACALVEFLWKVKVRLRVKVKENIEGQQTHFIDCKFSH